jgi:PAS domain-containing protein
MPDEDARQIKRWKRSAVTYCNCDDIASRVIQPAARGSARLCCTGPTTAAEFECNQSGERRRPSVAIGVPRCLCEDSLRPESAEVSVPIIFFEDLARLPKYLSWKHLRTGSPLVRIACRDFLVPIVMLLFEADSLRSGSGAIVELGLTALLAFALVLAVALWLRRIIARFVSSAARVPIHPGEADRRSLNGPGDVNALMGELEATIARLREREHQLRLVTDNAPVGIVHCDAELHYKFINKYHAERLKEHRGLAPEQVIGKRLPEVLGDTFFAILEPYIRECLTGKSIEFEVEAPFESAELR